MEACGGELAGCLASLSTNPPGPLPGQEGGEIISEGHPQTPGKGASPSAHPIFRQPVREMTRQGPSRLRAQGKRLATGAGEAGIHMGRPLFCLIGMEGGPGPHRGPVKGLRPSHSPSFISLPGTGRTGKGAPNPRSCDGRGHGCHGDSTFKGLLEPSTIIAQTFGAVNVCPDVYWTWSRGGATATRRAPNPMRGCW